MIRNQRVIWNNSKLIKYNTLISSNTIYLYTNSRFFMPKHTFSATLKAKNYTVKTKLDLLSFLEDGINIVYAPALDIYGYGESEHQAQESFGVCFEEYIRYTMNKHTFEADLNSKGWKISSKGKNISLTSPDIFSYIHN